MEPIDQSEFNYWINDPVTKKIFKALQEERDGIEKQLANSQVLLKPDVAQVVARLVGQREGLDLLLQIQYEDLEEENNEN